MYSINGDTRSRSDGELSFDGFVFDWLSKLQNCRGTEYKEGFDIAQTSCEAEVYRAADVTKFVRQYSFVAEELESPFSRQAILHVDAESAIAYIRRTGGGARLRHINIRSDWMNLLRSREEVDFASIPGTENPADAHTKISTTTHQP